MFNLLFVFYVFFLHSIPSITHGKYTIASEKPVLPYNNFRLIPRDKWNYKNISHPLYEIFEDNSNENAPSNPKDSVLHKSSSAPNTVNSASKGSPSPLSSKKSPPLIKKSPPKNKHPNSPPPSKPKSPTSQNRPTPPKPSSPPPSSNSNSNANTKPPPKNSPSKHPPPKKPPPKNSPPKNTPPKKPPPKNSSPKNTPPKNYPPKNTPPKNTSPKNSPPKNSPPKNSPPKNTPPKNTSPKSSPPKKPPPFRSPITQRRPPPVQSSPPKLSPPPPSPPETFTNYPVLCNDLSLTPKGYQGICYNGGPMLLKSIKVYIIWYGNWSNPLDSGRDIVRTFLSSFNAKNVKPPSKPLLRVSDWWQTVKLYPNVIDQTPSLNVTLVKEFEDFGYSSGSLFSNDYLQVLSVIVNALNDPNGLPYDSDGLYLVICSHDVVMQSVNSAYGGFCGSGYEGYCGTHNQAKLNDENGNPVDISFSWMGNPVTQCPNSCIPQYPYPPPDPSSPSSFTTSSPNNNWAADAIVAIIAHELAESATNLNSYSGWNGPNGGIGDLCSYSYGVGVGGKNNNLPYVYNMIGFNNSKFLIQRLWDAVSQACVSQAKIPASFIRP